jgi:hypothetical protein
MLPFSKKKEEGRRKKEEGRRKKEEGRKIHAPARHAICNGIIPL